MRFLVGTVFLVALLSVSSLAQNSSTSSSSPALKQPSRSATEPQLAAGSGTIPLIVAQGTPLQVALDREMRVRVAGKTVHGRVVQPMYAGDRIVIPLGTEVVGQITKIEGISGTKRFLSILNAEFTPARKVDVEFNELIFADGRRIPMHTLVLPGSGQVIQFVGAGEKDKKNNAKNAASRRVKEATDQAKQEWRNAMNQVHAPDKFHRIERYAIAQLPAHPQYIKAGTLYFAELQSPLDFGTEPFTPEMAASMNTPPPPDSLVHARLLTPLNSATTAQGETVQAIITQPLFSPDHHLIFLEGSILRGSVLQARPARRMHHNGELRIAFHELVPPSGVQQTINANIQGVQASQADRVKLDTEGGAQATTPNTRYLTTAISIGLAAMAFHTDNDAGKLGNDADGDGGSRAAGGLGGFKLPGLLLGAFVHSQPLGMGLGAYGASMSIYSHFFSRGQDIVFAKDTAMDVDIGTRVEPTIKP